MNASLQGSLIKPRGNCQNGSSTYRGAGGISEHLILWPGWHFTGIHGGPGGPPSGGFILFLFPSLLSLKIKDLCSVCFFTKEHYENKFTKYQLV